MDMFSELFRLVIASCSDTLRIPHKGTSRQLHFALLSEISPISPGAQGIFPFFG
jgi:hypothetical protein